MKVAHTLFAMIMLVLVVASPTLAAPKVDPELTARLGTAQSGTQFGVILTFQGSRITESQVAAV